MYPVHALLSYFFQTEVHSFSKNLWSPQNSRCQICDTKHLSYWEFTNIATIKNLLATATWRPGFFRPCCMTSVILSSRLCLGLPGGHVRAGFPDNRLYAFRFCPCVPDDFLPHLRKKTWTYRGAEMSLARPGRKQANVSVRMA